MRYPRLIMTAIVCCAAVIACGARTSLSSSKEPSGPIPCGPVTCPGTGPGSHPICNSDGCGVACDAPDLVPCAGGCCSVVSLSLNQGLGCAAKADGSLWCWGESVGHPQPARAPLDILVDEVTTDEAAYCVRDRNTHSVECFDSPTAAPMPWPRVSWPLDWTVRQLAADYGPLCALSDSGDMGCFYPFPPAPPLVVLGPWTMIAAAVDFQCALRSDGSVWCRGADDSGAIGPSPPTDTPVQILGLGGPATSIVASGKNVCALLSDGRVQCWGDNTFHNLGIELNIPFSSVPITVPNLPRDVVQISFQQFAGCALTSRNETFCWGQSECGQFGLLPADAPRAPPRQVSMFEGVISRIQVGRTEVCAIMAGGGVQCTGVPNADQSPSPVCPPPALAHVLENL